MATKKNTKAESAQNPWEEAAWKLAGPIDPVRVPFARPASIQTRYIFRDASDVGLSLMVTWPFFADALTSAWWYRGSRDVAEQMALVNLETLAVSGAVQGVTNVLVSRERPYGALCGSSALPADSIDCEGSTHYRSFFSGHSAFAFTSAALICMNHAKHELLGEPWDTLSCATGYAVAATTATFRVVADVHYASDVMAGALVGTLVGYGIPLLHYSRVELGTVRAGGLRLQIVPSGFGAGAGTVGGNRLLLDDQKTRPPINPTPPPGILPTKEDALIDPRIGAVLG